MDHPAPMRFLEAVADLARDADRLCDWEDADSVNQALQVLAGDVLHRDEVRVVLPAEIVHPADVPVGDGSCELQLVAEPLDAGLIASDLGTDQLEGELLPHLGIEDLVDAAHAALTEILDHLVASGECRAGLQFTDGRGRKDVGRGGKRLDRTR